MCWNNFFKTWEEHTKQNTHLLTPQTMFLLVISTNPFDFSLLENPNLKKKSNTENLGPDWQPTRNKSRPLKAQNLRFSVGSLLVGAMWSFWTDTQIITENPSFSLFCMSIFHKHLESWEPSLWAPFWKQMFEKNGRLVSAETPVR